MLKTIALLILCVVIALQSASGSIYQIAAIIALVLVIIDFALPYAAART